MLKEVPIVSRHGGEEYFAAKSHPVLAFAAALAAMVIWGGTPLFSKLATSQLDPLLVGVLRTVVAAALAGPLIMASGHRLPSDMRDRQLLALSGFAAFVVFPILFTVGQNATSGLHGALAGIGVLAGAWLVLRAGNASKCSTVTTGGNIHACPAANQPMQWNRVKLRRGGSREVANR